MVNYYCEVLAEYCEYLPGVYTFEDDPRYGVWSKHIMLVQSSHWVCKETENGVFWVKNRLTGCKVPSMLTEDELKQFMWNKLQAKEIA